ncbi:Protein kes1 [Cyphellophora attinorum]|uniref:Protein kes1 n=1 Tax=Cyphellophora attinorum TaxID=1664694 RepID=A0A0N0NRW9_9EURO|nr:Protein kes1 [Phialophora attinorum]KPI45578.1 Protein kes1 [Phialophora attinorum]
MTVLMGLLSRMSNLSALKDFLSFLATVSGDLSNITAPPFILASQSLTEFPAYWAERPSLFAAIANTTSPAERMLHVLQIYLTSLQRQYYIGKPVSEGTKKPLNPFLGELFLCECQDGDNKVEVICEQVSHHPPTTACFIQDKSNGVRAEAYSTQHTTLSGTSVVVKQSGHAILTVDRHNKESYLFPFPDVYAKSILTGSPYPELYGTYTIFSTSGYTAEVTFGGKSKNPFSSSSRNEFEAVIYNSKSTDPSSKKSPLYTLKGIWSDSWTITNHADNTTQTYNLSDPANKPAPMTLPQQSSPWHSRRAWADVASALQKGDFSAALEAKSKLENAQREMRKREKASGQTWQSAFFRKVDEREEGALMGLVDASGLDEKSIIGNDGCWRYDPARAEKFRRVKLGGQVRHTDEMVPGRN